MQNNINLDIAEYQRMRSSIYWVRQVYGLVPQPVKPQYAARFTLGLLMRGKNWDAFCASVTKDWFEPYRDGFHLTWQQALALYGVDKAMRGEVPPRISIVSGHGIGKSMMLSILILWFLFINPDSQVACTSPGKEQMYDVLWKELAKWIQRMPEMIRKLYVWESSHIRMKETPETWFARAKTASKENTEALAGVHADWVMMAVDEASGVEEPIFETMEGALTSGNVIVFLISNGTRSIGYFYDTHHKDKARWQNYAFSSLDSPRVDRRYVDAIIEKYGEDSVQYAIRVLGQFPDEGVMDDKGYVQLFNEKDIRIVPFDPNWKPVGRVRGALDASGEGQDSSDWAVRDGARAAIVAEEKTSTSGSMASRSLTICDKYEIDPSDFTVDAFGKGQDVGMDIAIATSIAKYKHPWRIVTINSGEPCEDDDDKLRYINQRAMMFYKLALWCRAGNELMDLPVIDTANKTTRSLRDELLSIRFRRTGNGRVQIMDKVTMKKLGFASPNKADALSMLFLKPERASLSPVSNSANQNAASNFDPGNTVGE